MSEENKLFEMLEMIYSEMLEIKTDVKDLKSSHSRLENIVTKIEYDHGKKLDALFDGHKQNTDKLDRVEKEVSKQEEVILRRIR